MEGKKVIKDEVEDEMLNKYSEYKEYKVLERDNRVPHLKRMALLDN